MQTTKVQLSTLKTPENNIRLHTENQLKEFRRSIEMFGQIRPIVIDENGTILAGNGLHQTLLSMGRETGDALVVKNLSEKDKGKLMLADNKIYSLGYDDNEKIFEVLNSLDGDYDVPGYDEDLLSELLVEDDGVDEMISDYGIITPEEKKTFDRADENLERKTEQAQQEETQDAPVNDGVQPQSQSLEPNSNTNEGQSEEQKTEVGRHIECPHCGEKVWL